MRTMLRKRTRFGGAAPVTIGRNNFASVVGYWILKNNGAGEEREAGETEGTG